MTLRDDLLEKLLVKTGDNNNLEPLLPSLPDKDVLAACASILSYVCLDMQEQREWPGPQALSILFGKTQGLIFDTQSGSGQSSFVGGFSRGAAAVGVLLVNSDIPKLQEVMSKLMPPIAIGDADIPPIAPWLVEPLIDSAANIIEKTDTLNLRDVLAFNYGVYWAACSIVPPVHAGRETAALKWLQAVTEYYGSLGIVPE